MKVKELLFEYGSTREGTIDEFMYSIVQQYCPNNFKAIANKEAPVLWRGARLEHDLIRVPCEQDDGTPWSFEWARMSARTGRTSATGNNSLMTHIDTHKEWADYPKRSNSVFCTTNMSWTANFGTPYMIIPFDDVKAYAASKTDMNLVKMGPPEFHKDPMILGSELNDIKSRLFKVKDVINSVYAKDSYPDEDAMLKPYIDAMEDIKSEFFSIRGIVRLDKTKLKDVSSDLKFLGRLFDSRPVDSIPYMQLKGKYAIAMYEALEPLQLYVQELLRFLDKSGANSIEDAFDLHITPKKLGVELYTSLSSIPDKKFEEIWFEGSYVMILAHEKYFLNNMKKFIKDYKI